MIHQNWRKLFSCAALIAGLAFADQLPMEPPHNAGQSITGAFEGWYSNPDGTSTILVGYFNRNLQQELDIPIGPNNKIEPGPADQGQPTHFLPGRQWGVFTITVPKDFGEKRLNWTIVANGKPTVIPLDVNPLYIVSPFVDAGGNTPPFIGFDPTVKPMWGPPRDISRSFTTSVASPLELPVWVADDAKNPYSMGKLPIPVVLLTWSKFRGPGDVKFSSAKPRVEEMPWKAPSPAVFTGKASTTATFSEPGEYVLEIVANDWSGDGGRGFQCCWSTAQVKVSVTKP